MLSPLLPGCSDPSNDSTGRDNPRLFPLRIRPTSSPPSRTTAYGSSGFYEQGVQDRLRASGGRTGDPAGWLQTTYDLINRQLQDGETEAHE